MWPGGSGCYMLLSSLWSWWLYVSGQGDGHCRREVPALPDSPPGCPQGAQQHVIQGALKEMEESGGEVGEVEPETFGSMA